MPFQQLWIKYLIFKVSVFVLIWRQIDLKFKEERRVNDRLNFSGFNLSKEPIFSDIFMKACCQALMLWIF